MSPEIKPNRCRLVLTLDIGRAIAVNEVAELAKAGDIASVILYNKGIDFAHIQKRAAALVEIFQAQGTAVMIAGDSQMAGRLKADGLHIEGKAQDFHEVAQRHRGKVLLGVSGIKTRHQAMEIGELEPDYLMFGKLGADSAALPHPRNLGLGSWWASMVEIPCIVQAGADLASLVAVTETGAEFVALEEAVFAAPDSIRALEKANLLLDKCAKYNGVDDQ